MMYSKWLWDELFFVSYHLHQPINMVKISMTPIERRYIIDTFIEQREKEHKAINKA